VEGSSDSVVLERLRVAFEGTGVDTEGKGTWASAVHGGRKDPGATTVDTRTGSPCDLQPETGL
jgi:hypothetical protein